MTYRLTNGGSIIRTADNAFIPPDSDNTDYQNYQAWLEEGNTPELAEVVPAIITPNWNGLVDSLIGNIEILSIIATNPLFPVLIDRLRTLRDSGTTIGDSEPLIAFWNHQAYSFSEEQVDTINQLTARNNIPLVLSDGGVLSPTTSP